VPGHSAGDRAGRAGATHLHHRTAVYPAGGEQADPPQAAPADLAGRGPGHGQPRRGACGGGAVGRDNARPPQGLGDDADRHRLLRGDRDRHWRASDRKRPRGRARSRGGLRLRADRDADEERDGRPVAGGRAVLHLLAAVRDRRGRGRCAILAAERPAGRLADRRPAAAHPRRCTDQLLLRGDGLQRERPDRRMAARRRDRRRHRGCHRLYRALPLAGAGAVAPASAPARHGPARGGVTP